MVAVVREKPMSRKPVEPRTSQVRLTANALQLARRASSFFDETITDYCNRVIAAQAEQDVRQAAAAVLGIDAAKPRKK